MKEVKEVKETKEFKELVKNISNLIRKSDIYPKRAKAKRKKNEKI